LYHLIVLLKNIYFEKIVKKKTHILFEGRFGAWKEEISNCI